jgi:hypothetical protein
MLAELICKHPSDLSPAMAASEKLWEVSDIVEMLEQWELADLSRNINSWRASTQSGRGIP